MSEIPEQYKDKDIYIKAKQKIFKQYEKPSAYRSMALQKEYQKLGGQYTTQKKSYNLPSWVSEEWIDVKCGDDKLDRHACRPLKPKNKTLSLDQLINKHGKEKMLQLAQMKKDNDKIRINWSQGKPYK